MSLLVKLIELDIFCACYVHIVIFVCLDFLWDLQFKSSFSTNSKDMTGMQQVSEGDTGKAQLMEALHHCQTRAREAEKTAKRVYAEKEHILKLFFRQTAQLFAYKQCFQLLQLKTLPWMPYKGRKQQKTWQKATGGKRVKRGRPQHDFTKYAVAFALGLGLVGAGLLVGWTAGWMLPPF